MTAPDFIIPLDDGHSLIVASGNGVELRHVCDSAVALDLDVVGFVDRDWQGIRLTNRAGEVVNYAMVAR